MSGTCRKCGAPNLQEARFCTECGTPFDPASAPPPKVTRGKIQVRRKKLAQTMALQPSPDEPAPASMSEALANIASQQAPSPDPPSAERTPATQMGVQAPDSGGAAVQSTTELDAWEQPVEQPGAAAEAPPPPERAPISEMLDEIDSTFENILDDPSKVEQGMSSADVEDVQELFRQITLSYVGPVRDFLVELELHELGKDWLAICLPAVTSIEQAAEQMGMADLMTALGDLKAALELAQGADGSKIAGEERAAILETAKGLAAHLPEAFAVEQERDRREPIIVASLLGRVPGVRKVQLDKVYRAGLSSLQSFYVASARELAETTGLEIDLAAAIVTAFADYRQSATEGPEDASRSGEIAQLGRLAASLADMTRIYDDRKTAPKRKREIRADRKAIMHEVNVILARIGEVQLVHALERMPSARVAEALELFTQERTQRQAG